VSCFIFIYRIYGSYVFTIFAFFVFLNLFP